MGDLACCYRPAKLSGQRSAPTYPQLPSQGHLAPRPYGRARRLHFISRRSLESTSQTLPCPMVSPKTSAPSSTHHTFQALPRVSTRSLRNITKQHRYSPPRLDGIFSPDLYVFQLLKHVHSRMRASQMCERLNREINPRSRVADLFPNKSFVLWLLTALLTETFY